MSNTFNTQRINTRKHLLIDCYSQNKMENIWRRSVRSSLRRQAILDLHDYYDFHKNRKQYIETIIHQIINGQYTPKQTFVLRLEKRAGVCRHIQIPSAEDALILETLVESYLTSILAKAPSPNAFFSRSHATKTNEGNLNAFAYPWWELWNTFQKKIYNFNQSRDYIVVTDITNYFDNISLEKLRNVITGLAFFDNKDKSAEGIIDFLFYCLESFLLRPDYLPQSLVGLPQIDFDAPRLLAHLFLYEIDEFLKERTQDNFVRWMDDIDFGVNSIAEGKQILCALDELLLSRGIRLNLGKTAILDAEDARIYFQPDENAFLTAKQNEIKALLKRTTAINAPAKLEALSAELSERFEDFRSNGKLSGRYEKILLRYFSVFTELKDPYLEKCVPELLDDTPALRGKIFYYYLILGFSETRLNHILNYINGEHCIDDVSAFAAIKLLVDWDIPHDYTALLKNVINSSTSSKTQSHFIGSLWLGSKYDTRSHLYTHIMNNKDLWKRDSFVARQVAATMPILQVIPEYKSRIIENLADSAQLDALRVIYNLKQLSFQQNLSKEDNAYLMHKHNLAYPLPKFLLSLHYILSPKLNVIDKSKLYDHFINCVDDIHYRKTIETAYSHEKFIND